jgi:hypothetical protein
MPREPSNSRLTPSPNSRASKGSRAQGWVAADSRAALAEAAERIDRECRCS